MYVHEPLYVTSDCLLFQLFVVVCCFHIDLFNQCVTQLQTYIAQQNPSWQNKSLQLLNYKFFCDKKDTFECNTDFEQCTAFD